MLTGGPEKAALARDTVFSAVMIVCTGVVGLCLLAGASRHREQEFRVQGANGALAVLAALSVLTMVLPNYTQQPGPTFTNSQLEFVGVVSLVLYGVFVFVQTVRHRDYFLAETEQNDDHLPPPSGRMALAAAGLLVVSLVAVVGLAKALSPAVEAGVAASGAPKALVGVIIAAVVLLPESLAAVKAARLDRLQDEPQPRLWFRHREHRPHHPCGGGGLGGAGATADTRARTEGDGAAGADPGAEHADRGDGPDVDSAGRHSPDRLRRVPVLRGGALV